MIPTHGNPYLATLERHVSHVGPEATATLALAFEQRTIALIEYAKFADDETADLLWVDHIAPRLGLDETNE